MELIMIFSWIAVVILASSYWFQIYKIHKHKEVRDLSIIYHILLATGFGILTITAYFEKSFIFLIKQIVTFVPVLIIVWQIYVHREDSWHDEDDPNCKRCKNELDPEWKYCPECGTKNIRKIIMKNNI